MNISVPNITIRLVPETLSDNFPETEILESAAEFRDAFGWDRVTYVSIGSGVAQNLLGNDAAVMDPDMIVAIPHLPEDDGFEADLRIQLMVRVAQVVQDIRFFPPEFKATLQAEDLLHEALVSSWHLFAEDRSKWLEITCMDIDHPWVVESMGEDVHLFEDHPALGPRPRAISVPSVAPGVTNQAGEVMTAGFFRQILDIEVWMMAVPRSQALREWNKHHDVYFVGTDFHAALLQSNATAQFHTRAAKLRREDEKLWWVVSFVLVTPEMCEPYGELLDGGEVLEIPAMPGSTSYDALVRVELDILAFHAALQKGIRQIPVVQSATPDAILFADGLEELLRAQYPLQYLVLLREALYAHMRSKPPVVSVATRNEFLAGDPPIRVFETCIVSAVAPDEPIFAEAVEAAPFQGFITVPEMRFGFLPSYLAVLPQQVKKDLRRLMVSQMKRDPEADWRSVMVIAGQNGLGIMPYPVYRNGLTLYAHDYPAGTAVALISLVRQGKMDRCPSPSCDGTCPTSLFINEILADMMGDDPCELDGRECGLPDWMLDGWLSAGVLTTHGTIRVVEGMHDVLVNLDSASRVAALKVLVSIGLVHLCDLHPDGSPYCTLQPILAAVDSEDEPYHLPVDFRSTFS